MRKHQEEVGVSGYLWKKIDKNEYKEVTLRHRKKRSHESLLPGNSSFGVELEKVF